MPAELKDERKARFMAVQEKISGARLRRKVGTTLTVLIDSAGATGATARSAADAPEIDGLVHIAAHASLEAGAFARVKITSSDAHDLRGVVV